MHSGVLLSATARPQINETITYTRICREKGKKRKKKIFKAMTKYTGKRARPFRVRNKCKNKIFAGNKGTANI